METWEAILAAAKSMSALEIIAVFFGISSVWFSKKENILVYPTGIISVLIYVYLCYGAGLYADAGINGFYFIMSLYGWYNWNKKKNDLSLPISKNSLNQNLIAIIATAGVWGLLYLLLVKFTDSTVPMLDALTTALCFVGMWFMAWKKVENWIFWIIADLISVPLYYYKGLPLTAVQFLLFTVLAVAGYLEWRKKLLSHD